MESVIVKKTFPSRALPILVLALTLLCVSCVHKRQAAGLADIEGMRSGDFVLERGDDIPRSVYVDVSGMKRQAVFSSRAGADLRSLGYELSTTPSRAGHIVQISVLQFGPVDPAGMKAAVDAGYGAPARLAGGSGTGLLADVLLVQRRVPAGSREGVVQLKNISNRNALGSSSIRVGLLAKQGGTAHDDVFMDALLHELCLAVSNSGKTLNATAGGGILPAPDGSVKKEKSAAAGEKRKGDKKREKKSSKKRKKRKK